MKDRGLGNPMRGKPIRIARGDDDRHVPCALASREPSPCRPKKTIHELVAPIAAHEFQSLDTVGIEDFHAGGEGQYSPQCSDTQQLFGDRHLERLRAQRQSNGHWIRST